MPRAKLTLTLPEGTWIRDVSSAHPETDLRVVAVLSAEASGTALLELRTDNPVSLLAAVDGHDDVTSLELLWKHDDRSMVQVETTQPRLLFPIVRAGVPVETPFDVRDGEVEWELTTSSERLSALRDRLDAGDIRFETDYVRDDPRDGEGRLTDRQRQVLTAAAERGYYATPRETTLTEVSSALGISKATGSDILHRAEGTVVDWYLEEHAGDPN
ncbi:MAG: helix-turn-helix domain-containing protein [Halobacteriales archaeon]